MNKGNLKVHTWSLNWSMKPLKYIVHILGGCLQFSVASCPSSVQLAQAKVASDKPSSVSEREL